MTGRILAVVAASLLSLTCGCLPRGERTGHQSVQRKRADGRQVAAVAALLKAQGRDREAARLQTQCAKECPDAISAPQAAESTPTREHKKKTPHPVPPVPQLSEPPEPAESAPPLPEPPGEPSGLPPGALSDGQTTVE
ncbi:MAG: hypothetical protein NXI04_11495 [Planctomycetaceae bacterium]|nr:hypothetical protein [Planctomycetaceae bacterium]